MKRNSTTYQTYLEILHRELVPAAGCTEPIAVAYCAAKAREVLGALPERVEVIASGNIIKNVKSVVVPNTDGARGIAAAAAIGIIGGDPHKKLEVIAEVTDAQREAFKDYLSKTPITLIPAESELVLDIAVRAYAGEQSAFVRIINHHTGICQMEKNGEIIFEEAPDLAEEVEETPEYEQLSVANIWDFAQTVALDDVRPVLDQQIACNTAIAEEGMRGDYGANIGKIILKMRGDSVFSRAVAKAAAGSDARMSGCELPVVINCGSGNQGITVSVPVLEYAKELGSSQEQIYRALTLSNLLALHLKHGIGRLSAYCGAISAGVCAGAAVAYLKGGDLDVISHTIVNSLAIASGIICDGAKASCAAKIASALDAGLLGYEMYLSGQQFYHGDGLVAKGVENTIKNISQLGKEGMRETDKTIIEIMTKSHAVLCD